MDENEKRARAIVAAILGNMRRRRGLRQSWDDIDDGIQKEIEEEWVRLALVEVSRER